MSAGCGTVRRNAPGHICTTAVFSALRFHGDTQHYNHGNTEKCNEVSVCMSGTLSNVAKMRLSHTKIMKNEDW